MTPVSNPAPAPEAPVSTVGGGCGSGQLASPVSGTVTGNYGEDRGSHAHAGKDIAAPTGTTVRAAQCGTVTKAGADSGGYGNLVCIQHEGGVSTCYAHLSSIGTKVGTYVHVGDAIGKVGCTGSCTGPHLHFEVREHDKPVNPEPYLSGAKNVPALEGQGDRGDGEGSGDGRPVRGDDGGAERRDDRRAGPGHRVGRGPRRRSGRGSGRQCRRTGD